MSASAANHLIEGGKKTLSESGRSGENICLLPGKRKSSRPRRKSEQSGKRGEQRREKKMGRIKKGMGGRQDARLSANGTRLH